MKLNDLAKFLGAELEGNGEAEVKRVARIEDAVPGDLTFVANPRYGKFLGTTRATAVIIARDLDTSPLSSASTRPSLLKTENPYLSFVRVMARFNPPADPVAPGIHPSAVISPSATLGSDVRIGALAYIGDGVMLGNRVHVGHGTVLGDHVRVGDDSLLYHNVTVREDCVIGKRAVVQPGATIGSDGFGFAPTPSGAYEKIPQLGIVVIEDDVEIGANCAIDRATMGETRIRKGVKLDNLIQVAHNVVIGENTVIAAQAGISGSTRIGAGSMIGGQVGITGHLTIAEGTKVGAQSGIHRSVKEPGHTFFGSPAVGKREAFRIQGALLQLPDFLEMVRQLRETVENLERRLSGPAGPDGTASEKSPT